MTSLLVSRTAPAFPRMCQKSGIVANGVSLGRRTSSSQDGAWIYHLLDLNYAKSEGYMTIT